MRLLKSKGKTYLASHRVARIRVLCCNTYYCVQYKKVAKELDRLRGELQTALDSKQKISEENQSLKTQIEVNHAARVSVFSLDALFVHKRQVSLLFQLLSSEHQ